MLCILLLMQSVAVAEETKTAPADEKSWYDGTHDWAKEKGEKALGWAGEKVSGAVDYTIDKTGMRPVVDGMKAGAEIAKEAKGPIVPADLNKAKVDAQAEKTGNQLAVIFAKIDAKLTSFKERAKTVFFSIMSALALIALIILGIRLVFSSSDSVVSLTESLVGFIFKVTIFTGLAVGTMFFLSSVPSWLSAAGQYIATGSAPTAKYNIPNLLTTIGATYETVWNGTPKGFITGIFAIIALGVVFYVLGTIYYHYLIAMFEMILVGIVGIIPLAFGVLDYTKQWAYDQIKYAMALGMKLMVFAIAIAVLPMLIQGALEQIPKEFNVVMIMFFLIVLVALTGFAIALPQIAQGMIAGAVVDSSKSLSQATSAVGGIAKMGAGVAVAGAAVGMMAGSAANQAGGALAKGALNKIAGGSGGGAQSAGLSGNQSNFASQAGSLSVPTASNPMAGRGGSGSAGAGGASNLSSNLQSGATKGSAADTLGSSNSSNLSSNQGSKGVDTSANSSTNAQNANGGQSAQSSNNGVKNDLGANSANNAQNNAVNSNNSQQNSDLGGKASQNQANLDTSAGSNSSNSTQKGGKDEEKPLSLAEKMLNSSKGIMTGGAKSFVQGASGGMHSGDLMASAINGADSLIDKIGSLGKSAVDAMIGRSNKDSNKYGEQA